MVGGLRRVVTEVDDRRASGGADEAPYLQPATIAATSRSHDLAMTTLPDDARGSR